MQNVCINCKYHDQTYQEHICSHPFAVSPVTGALGMPCSKMRAPNAACGVEGKLYLPDPPQSPGVPPAEEYKWHSLNF